MYICAPESIAFTFDGTYNEADHGQERAVLLETNVLVVVIDRISTSDRENRREATRTAEQKAASAPCPTSLT